VLRTAHFIVITFSFQRSVKRSILKAVACNCNRLPVKHRNEDQQELISRLDSRTLHPVNELGLLVFSNNIKNGISDIRDIKRRIMA